MIQAENRLKRGQGRQAPLSVGFVRFMGGRPAEERDLLQ